MSAPRPHPFDLVFGELAAERFPPIQAALEGEATLDQWLMTRPVLDLLADLRPDAGLGSAVDDFVLFVHACYLWWAAGSRTVAWDDMPDALTTPMYIQVPPHRIWARLDAEETHEPLDGWFVLPDGERRRVVACLGVHPARPGLSVLVAAGSRPIGWRRADGGPTFAPVMTGGDTAGLWSIAAPEELLLLAWGAELGERIPDDDYGSQGGRRGD